MKQNRFKSPYFWGISLGILFIAFNVLSKPLINSYSESQINQIDFSKLQVKTLNGKTVALKEISKSKKVVVNFWATWCRPCLTEMPIMEEAYKNLKDDYIFIMINDGTVEATKKYINKNNYSFEFVQIDREAFIKNGIMERPTTLLLDSNFNIKEVVIGEIPQKNGKEFAGFLNKY